MSIVLNKYYNKRKRLSSWINYGYFLHAASEMIVVVMDATAIRSRAETPEMLVPSIKQTRNVAPLYQIAVKCLQLRRFDLFIILRRCLVFLIGHTIFISIFSTEVIEFTV